MYRYAVICGIIWICHGPGSLDAQINVKIGYVPSFLSLPVTNERLSIYTPAEGEITEPFGTLRFAHGIQLGVRWQLGPTSLALEWERLNNNKTATSYLASSDRFDMRTYKFGLTNILVGFDQLWDRVGFGLRYARSTYAISRAVAADDLKLQADIGQGLRFNLIYILQKSPSISLSLQPFYQVGLSKHRPFGLEDDFGIVGETTERIHFWGLSVVFYNGRQ